MIKRNSGVIGKLCVSKLCLDKCLDKLSLMLTRNVRVCRLLQQIDRH